MEAGRKHRPAAQRADAALYEAKESGRNRVMAARPPDSKPDPAQGSGVVRTAGRSASAEQNDPHAPPQRSPHPEVVMTSLPAGTSSGQSYPASAYVLDDEPQIAALVGKVLAACGITPRQFTAPAPFLAALEVSPPHWWCSTFRSASPTRSRSSAISRA